MSIQSTEYNEKSPEYSLIRLTGREVFTFKIGSNELEEKNLVTDGIGVSVPFVVLSNQLVIPHEFDGTHGWMRHYNGYGNNIRSQAMKILASSSGEVVLGSDGYGGIFIVDGKTDIHALMEEWRAVDVSDRRVFDARTNKSEHSRGTNIAVIRVINAYRELLGFSDKIK